ncbi:hypothetical protein PGT21_012980 [Puccinia graminis f. sp. tritici]|uniref:Uncharacterized protein n=1 Tax=Puccinia graminis f. sp. tritici TaxID=56615 RepID=A0A5B0RTQ2_PUCGR|nr:hypothetical protein PGT21_012980 [Puccinia graminis f. sp. tritici]KAA1129271.1 hypothetical protein PGTUg99_022174 [Puccinia graminis f. sp. tritici]
MRSALALLITLSLSLVYGVHARSGDPVCRSDKCYCNGTSPYKAPYRPVYCPVAQGCKCVHP